MLKHQNCLKRHGDLRVDKSKEVEVTFKNEDVRSRRGVVWLREQQWKLRVSTRLQNVLTSLYISVSQKLAERDGLNGADPSGRAV